MRALALSCLLATLTAPLRAAPPSDVPPEVELPPDAESFDDRHRPEAEPWRARPFAVEGHLGLGAPLGLVGVAFDVSPSAGFSLNAGVGLGHSTWSPQLGLGVRTRVIVAHGFALGAEGGMSEGRYEQQLDCPTGNCPPEWHFRRAVWGNAGLLLERRTDSGLALRWSFGAAAIFNVTDGQCHHCDATDEPSMWDSTVPYTLFTAGWAFGP